METIHSILGGNMAKYLIHTCGKRKWYVDSYLIPSMLNQGIKRENLWVYNDDAKKGCLRSFIDSARLIPRTSGGVWHLQDDVVISSDFRLMTEEFDDGIVCGFCSYYSEGYPMGIRHVRDMWYSFPCIRIPNSVLRGFIEWLESVEIQKRYQAYFKENKFVDTLFRIYVLERCGDMLVHNLYPNIVDNIDYLLGGSIINCARTKSPASLYFNDSELVQELKESLQNK